MKRSFSLAWALVLMHDILGIGPFVPQPRPKQPHTLAVHIIDLVAGPHLWVAALHLCIANMILLALIHPRWNRLARWALLASVGFFVAIGIALTILTVQNQAYVLSGAFCIALTIISWRAYVDMSLDPREQALRAAAEVLVQSKDT